MPAGVVLDTSYFITLADPTRSHHQAARLYWRHFTQNAIPLYLPTIVVSEFYLRQELPPDILRACVVLPFNWQDAIMAASLELPAPNQRGAVARGALKDDLKILAQAIVKDAAWVITDDINSFYKFAKKLRDSGNAAFRPIKLEDGYDLSLLNESGQHEIGFGASEPDPNDGT